MHNLVLNVAEACRKVNGENNEYHVALRIAERSKSIVFLLPCRIPKRKLNKLALELLQSNIVFEDRRNVSLD